MSFEPLVEYDDDPGYDQFWSNPHRPVPIMEGTHRGMPREYMVADQRFGPGGWSLDRVMRQIPDHFHAHARDPGWWSRRFGG